MPQAHDPVQLAQARRRQRAERHRTAEAWRAVATSEAGQLVLQEIVADFCGYHGKIRTGSSDTYVQIGQREVALRIRARIEEPKARGGLGLPECLLEMERRWRQPTPEGDVREEAGEDADG